MNLTVAGGCGEHGRNCFLVEAEGTALLLDCGMMAGAAMPYPRLSDAQIRKADWLFLSHSHLDHAGAYPFLREHGYKGRVVLTEETASQLPFAVEASIFLDRLAPVETAYPLGQGVTVAWGRSGHCAGSCWYRIALGSETLFYSGDYVEDTLVYACDPVRGQRADLAIVDSAYGQAKQTPRAYREALAGLVEPLTQQRKEILFPVPRYGRGLELMAMLCARFPQTPCYADEHLLGELRRLERVAEWMKQPAISALKEIQPGALNGVYPVGGFLFVADPQLKQAQAQAVAGSVIERGGTIVLTGNTDPGTHSDTLRKEGRALFARYPVHMSNQDRERLAERNDWGRVVAFHCAEEG